MVLIVFTSKKSKKKLIMLLLLFSFLAKKNQSTKSKNQDLDETIAKINSFNKSKLQNGVNPSMKSLPLTADQEDEIDSKNSFENLDKCVDKCRYSFSISSII